MTGIFPRREKAAWQLSTHKSSWDIKASLMYCTATHQVVAYIYTETTVGSEPKRDSFWWTINVQELHRRKDKLHFIMSCSSVEMPYHPSIPECQAACETAINSLLAWAPKT